MARKPPKLKPPPKVRPAKRARAFAFAKRPLGFVHSASASIAIGRAMVQRIGLALIGGDFTGNARGDYSVDLQGERQGVAQVASGASAVAIGNENTASGAYSVALGLDNFARGQYAVCLGVGNDADGLYSSALGAAASAVADRAVAIGVGAVARVVGTTVIASPICGQRGDVAGPTFWFNSLASAEVILRTGWIDALAVADYDMPLPAGCRFWIHDVGVIVSDIAGFVSQPSVHFGIAGTPNKYVGDQFTVGLTALGRAQVFSPGVLGDGETDLLFGLGTAGAATRLQLSAYWRGILMETN